MISYIKGTLVEKAPARIVVDNSGLGYEILLPLSSYDMIGDIGSEVLVYTHFHVREDSQTLFGFATTKERKLFQMLISVSGIGPRSALTILSGVSVDDFCDAVAREEEAFLTAISGIGRKTAQRLIVELKGRIVEEAEVRVGVGGAVYFSDQFMLMTQKVKDETVNGVLPSKFEVAELFAPQTPHSLASARVKGWRSSLARARMMGWVGLGLNQAFVCSVRVILRGRRFLSPS